MVVDSARFESLPEPDIPERRKRSNDIPVSESAFNAEARARVLSVMFGSTTDAISGLSGDARSNAGPASVSSQPVFTGRAGPAAGFGWTTAVVSVAELPLSGLHDTATNSKQSNAEFFAR
jgi:hypothetical protein